MKVFSSNFVDVVDNSLIRQHGRAVHKVFSCEIKFFTNSQNFSHSKVSCYMYDNTLTLFFIKNYDRLNMTKYVTITFSSIS